MEAATAVSMKGIVKIYPDGTEALRGVDFGLTKGEVHGLLGENGAGKTTLAKILSGLLPLTAGQIRLDGREIRFAGPWEALKEGIGMVYQHFALVRPLTAIQNIMLGQEGGGAFSSLDVEEAKKLVAGIMEQSGLKVPLDVPVELLPIGVQQRVEILKLLYRRADILILDEPTSALTPVEVDTLFEMLRAFKKEGKTVIFITHKLREVLDITDRITVLRKGKVAGVLPTAEATPEGLAELMVGMKSLPVALRSEKPFGRPVLSVEAIRVKNDFGGLAAKDLSFEVRSGEIFSIAGVHGNGQTELLQALVGLRRREKGKVTINGKETDGMGPRELFKMGLAFVPEDRRRLGLVLDLNVAENSILGMEDDRRFLGRLKQMVWGKIFEYTRRIIKRFGILTPSVRTPARYLSGGNQQRLVVGRELNKEPSVLVVAEPTRGLDVAATHFIRDLLCRMRDQGKAILLVSADLDEVMQLSDTIAVIYEGAFMKVAPAKELGRTAIGLMMGGVMPT